MILYQIYYVIKSHLVLKNSSYEKWSEEKVNNLLDEKMTSTFNFVSNLINKDKLTYRQACFKIAIERINNRLS